MAVAETQGRWPGAAEHWRAFLPEAHKWLAAYEALGEAIPIVLRMPQAMGTEQK